MIIRRMILFLLAAFALGCSSDDNESVDANAIYIRVLNQSSHDFKNVVVDPFNSEENYGDISSHDYSYYQKFDRAYRYAYIEVELDGQIYTIQPTDFVGEEPIESGLYTHQLKITYDVNHNRHLVSTLQKD